MKLPWPRSSCATSSAQTCVSGSRSRTSWSPIRRAEGGRAKYKYASHGLRFDVKRPTETVEDFQRRLGNQAAREEGGDAPQPETERRRPLVRGKSGCATPAPCTPTSGQAPAPNSPTAATSASSRSAAGGKRTAARTAPACRSATPCSSRCTPTRSRQTSTRR